jgi:hypothetical protein
MKNLYILSAFVLILLTTCTSKDRQNEFYLDLSGTWKFATDPQDRGIAEQCYLRDLPEKVVLPGSMADNGKGDKPGLLTDWTGSIVDSSYFTQDKYAKYRTEDNFKIPFWLTPVKHYKNPAWYQKKIKISENWQNRQIILHLERCHWETTVFVDDRQVGSQNSLAVPHEYNLTEYLNPGSHTLTIRVDNRMIIPVGINSHSVSDHTQSNWNGIIGKLALEVKNQVSIGEVRITPDIHQKVATTQITLHNPRTEKFEGILEISASAFNTDKEHVTGTFTQQVSFTDSEKTLQHLHDMGSDVQLWSEFNPALYHLTVTLKDNTGQVLDKATVDFGMREFKAEGRRFTVNGQPVFLRGTVECCIFPRTGYPPMDRESWERIFKICADYGLNHMRFHSWCPPEAAFQAADKLGFYLQVECSSWANFPNSSVGDGLPVDRFIYEESDRIIKEYGNHPSFCMLAYGNEPGGDHQEKYLSALLKYWKSRDTRRVYTSGAGWPFIADNDYHNGPQPRIQYWGAGLTSIINSQPPQTMFDYSDILADYQVPWVSHEIGQWCAYPDFSEMSEYTGTLKATNFEIFKETLEENNMGHLANNFLMASGKLQVLCYKAEIEAALRTPELAGFQLLELHDFPGQGTALVGILNAFFESKGYVTAEEFRNFCNRTVLLARMEKMVFLSKEEFIAGLELSHFGSQALEQPVISWTVSDQGGNTLQEGKCQPERVEIGNRTVLGEVRFALPEFTTPEKLTLAAAIEGTGCTNHWDFWVYPENVTMNPGQVHITRELDLRSLNLLREGVPVLLLPYGSVRKDKGADVAIGFSSIFWNTAWTNGQAPHTLGIFCNPDHPVFKDFPTEYHSNWQWWDPVSHSQAMILDGFDAELTPLIQPIDTWFENRRLALLFEAKVENGKLMVCSVDLDSDLKNRPVARQLKNSILEYMNSSEFDPQVQADLEQISSLIIPGSK